MFLIARSWGFVIGCPCFLGGVSVGVGRLLNLICVDELMAMFWQHLVILEAPDPHGGPFM